jgi:putative transferase (TIGR04331 family)
MSGTKYCISQHGGVYGTMVVPPKAEFVEHRVADKWFSWGWQKKGFENVVPGLNLKNCTTSYVSKRSDGNLLISLPTLRYCPVRIVYNNHNEITSQIGKFISDLNNVFPDKIVIRANPNQKKSDITRTIPSSFKLSKTKKFWDEMSQSRLFVCLNNSTTVLEALSMNFPTVLIFTGAEALFREESKPYFKLLHEARILHFSYSSAVEHIDLIWNDVDNWWNEINLQDSRKKFCSNYSNTNSDWDGLLANFIMSCN